MHRKLQNTIVLFMFLFSYFNGQELVQCSMGSNYTYDIYYSLEYGITAYPDRTNWELAFSTNDLSA